MDDHPRAGSAWLSVARVFCHCSARSRRRFRSSSFFALPRPIAKIQELTPVRSADEDDVTMDGWSTVL